MSTPNFIEEMSQRLKAIKEEILVSLNRINQNILLLEEEVGQDEKYIAYIQQIHKVNELLRENTNKYLNPEVINNALKQVDVLDFLAKVRHDLRNPLNAIQGYSELLYEDIKETKKNDLKSAANNIIKSSQHLLEIIEQI
jgi:two-component system CheB/CheR fusion protein